MNEFWMCFFLIRHFSGFIHWSTCWHDKAFGRHCEHQLHSHLQQLLLPLLVPTNNTRKILQTSWAPLHNDIQSRERLWTHSYLWELTNPRNTSDLQCYFRRQHSVFLCCERHSLTKLCCVQQKHLSCSLIVVLNNP